MSNNTNKTDYRYVNDLRRLAYSQGKLIEQKKFLILLGIAAIFLILVAVAVEQYISLGSEQTFILVAAAMVGGYMALNICLLYTSPSPRDSDQSRMPSSA